MAYDYEISKVLSLHMGYREKEYMVIHVRRTYLLE